jgi:UDP-glucose 4-epimerase
MKVLITGASGFIGSHLMATLKHRGFETIGFDKTIRSREVIKGDCQDKANLKKAIKKDVDWIVHLAANPDARAGPSELFHDNVAATSNVIELVNELRIPELTFASSSTVYGEGKMPVAEGAPLQPISFYGWTKLFCEELLKRHANSKTKITIVRYANVVGPRGHGVIPDLVAKLRRDPHELEVFGDGSQSKSYVYVDDAISGLIAAQEANKTEFDVFNVGTEDEITVREIVHEVCEMMKLEPNVVWKPAQGGRGWEGDVRVMRLEIEKLKAIGWRPKLSSLEAVTATLEGLLQVGQSRSKGTPVMRKSG